MFMTKAMKEALEQAYKAGYDAGYTAKSLEQNKEEEHRLGQVYTFGYQLGAEDALAKHGIVEISEEDKIHEELMTKLP